MKADLHCHTNASDSILSRRDTLDLASSLGLDYLAITDHDLMNNSFVSSGDPVKAITGCEMSTVEPETKKKCHILCYLPKDKSALEPLFARMNASRASAGRQMFEKVRRLYPVLTEERLSRYCPSGIIHKQDMMNVLIDFGYERETFGPLYDKLFSSRNGSCFVEPVYNDAVETVKAMREAGGIIVVAHPKIYGSLPFIWKLAEMGLIDGVEDNHPSADEETRKQIAEVCERFSLIKTGGSDYHGSNSSNYAMLGDYLTDSDELSKLFQLSERRR
ncbi:MAG: PHP domain-containing protein [Ruminococcaceae bacterium]|nr:PHP domain-containing protein [Oscillospiraceae bacterium]